MFHKSSIRLNGALVKWDSKGDAALQVFQDEMGVNQETANRLMAHAALHVAILNALKNKWNSLGSNGSFVEFVSNDLSNCAKILRDETSNRTIKSFALLFTAGKNKDVFDQTDPLNLEQSTCAADNNAQTIVDINFVIEIIRATVEFMRDGKIYEEHIMRELLESCPTNSSLVQEMPESIKHVKNKLICLINPKTCPKEIGDLISCTNYILDRYC